MSAGVEQSCPLCGTAAACGIARGDGGELIDVSCTRCARYLISPWAASKLTTDYALLRELLAAQARSDAAGLTLVIDEQPSHTPFPVRARRLPEGDVPRATEHPDRPARPALRFEGDIGQLVMGNVYTAQLVFKVGDSLVPLPELTDEELLSLQKLLRRARRRREAFASTPLGLWGITALTISVAFFQWAPIKDWRDVITAAAFLIFISGMLWTYIRAWIGTSPRVQRSIAAQIEDRLVLVNLEIDMRTLRDKPRSVRQMFRDWLDSHND
jgi:hypothetical protein